ncbi:MULTISPECIES: bifunctional copper resistance protein CopD/cytochrome c oxidase assembly protein [Mycolicibacterium]|uniref:bifunctional copper resistance protein CopD/cytochrome c oxidase assembly protein n=1 Tax=Mycolicibacterium TaxID=1866885 RepID=UPI0013FD4DBC|nr:MULTISPECIES: bifunctional copper resistance protein CopD/cytochrome c oxidase assembly protein [Mycolicibacterium]MCV7432669.1 bifunctional copper resistance protein CopD/cytochrome c oxidase assembly protein [Mycolicibacterium bacteremicum]QVI28302.1 bifunctional copper resistance protein CopD/cytochrome c oxidase assembly protein [Mycolicibacterium neoaurum]
MSVLLLAAVAALAAATAALIGAASLADALTATGLPNPGPVTTYGLPAVRAAGEIAAAVAVGGFLVAAFLAPPQSNGVLDVGGYRAVRLGGYACAVWALCAALLVALSVSDVSGVPLHQIAPGDIWAAADLVEITNAWRWTAGLAAVVAVASLAVLRWAPTPFLLLAVLATLVPLGLSGHSSSGGAHDMATNSLLIHLFASALWVGGLLALLAHAWRVGTHLDTAARRYSAIALCCFVAVAASGLINAALRIAPGELFSDYGVLLIGKAVALTALGGLGWAQRRYAVAALGKNPRARGPLLGLGIAEGLIFAVTVGIAVGLSRTPPPPGRVEPTAAEMAIGFQPAGPPTLARVTSDWRFDLILGTAALVLAGLYVAGLRRLRQRHRRWPGRRTACWLGGCLCLLVVTSSGLGSYMPAMFSMHVLYQALLSTLVPALLVGGAPIVLAAQALPATAKPAAPGLREWWTVLLRSPLGRAMTHPVVVTVAYAGGAAVFYTGPVFAAAIDNHSAHVLSNMFFLVTGCLFFGAITASARTTRQRYVMAAAALFTYAGVGASLMVRTEVVGEYFYRSIRLPWHTDLLADQWAGGAIAVAASIVSLLAALAGTLWSRHRHHARFSRDDRAVTPAAR